MPSFIPRLSFVCWGRVTRALLGPVIAAGLFTFSACGSDDEEKKGSGGSGGSGGGTTCLDGYPKIGTACAIMNELCKSCPTGAACCDEIRCQGGVWVMTQSHGSCPADASSEAGNDASDANPDAAPDSGADAVSDSGGDAAPDSSIDAAEDSGLDAATD